MRYFAPELSPGVLEAEQTEMVEKFGGFALGPSAGEMAAVHKVWFGTVTLIYAEA